MTITVSLLLLASQYQELALANCLLSALNKSATSLISKPWLHMFLNTSSWTVLAMNSMTGYEDAVLEFVIVY